MISARISLERGWGDAMARRIEQQARVELERAVEDGAKAASQASLSRRRTGTMAQMETLPVVATPRGFTSGFRSKAWYAGFQSRGTKRGISALGFLEKGRTAARKSFISRIDRL